MTAAQSPERRAPGIRVLIVDDQAVMRTGLRVTLLTYGDIDVVGEASSGPQAVARTAQLRPDVVLMDLRMPGGDGVSATGEIVAAGTDTAVLVLTTFDIDEDIYRAIDAGARGYLLKDIEPDALVAAIRSAARGTDVVDAKVVRPLLIEFRRRQGPSTMVVADDNPLSEREREILLGLADGRTNRQIATELVMEPGGVKSAIARMLGKYDAASRTQLVSWAFRSGYLR